MSLFQKRKKSRVTSKQRIGPHEKIVISTLVGSLLGDGCAEKRSNATRFHIHMSNRNREYLLWLHQFFSEKGYCSEKKPSVCHQVDKDNKVTCSSRFCTYSFASLNWLYDAFYLKGKKGVPVQIYDLLDVRAFAIWFMDDGGKSGQGAILCTDGFTLEDLDLLQKTLKEKFGLITTTQRHGKTRRLYFPVSQIPRLSTLLKAHMIPCMHYKLNHGRFSHTLAQRWSKKDNFFERV